MPDELDFDDDNDGINDIFDPFPLNANEWEDTDGDGVGDNADMDDDNDGFIDILDTYPKYAGFTPSDDLIESNRETISSSGSTIVGNKALLLLFTTTIAMGMILGARKLVKNPSNSKQESAEIHTELTMEDKL